MSNTSLSTGTMIPYTVDKFISDVNSTNTKEVDNLIQLICSKLAANDSGAPPPGCLTDKYTDLTTPSHSPEVKDSFLEILSVSKTSKILLPILFTVILAAALAGNTLVLITVIFNKIMWTTMHMFIVSLAVSDILVSVTCIPMNIGQAVTTDWTFGSLACQMMPFFMHVSITASTLTLCCMAAERYLAIVHPLKLNGLQTIERAMLLLCGVWLIAMAVAAPYAYFYDTKDIRVCSTEKCYEHTLCKVREESLFAAANLHWLTFLVLFILPATILLITYGIIIYKLWVKAPVGVVMISAAGMRTRYKRKAIKMLVLVVLLFLACWAPLLTFDLIAMANKDIHPSSFLMNLRFYLQCLALSSTAYNPIVYAFMNQKFRVNFQNLLLRHRNRVVPITTEREELPQGGEAIRLKTGSSNSGIMTTFRSGSSPVQTRLTKM